MCESWLGRKADGCANSATTPSNGHFFSFAAPGRLGQLFQGRRGGVGSRLSPPPDDLEDGDSQDFLSKRDDDRVDMSSQLMQVRAAPLQRLASDATAGGYSAVAPALTVGEARRAYVLLNLSRPRASLVPSWRSPSTIRSEWAVERCVALCGRRQRRSRSRLAVLGFRRLANLLTQLKSLIRARTSRWMLAVLPFTSLACDQGAGIAPAEIAPARTRAALIYRRLRRRRRSRPRAHRSSCKRRSYWTRAISNATSTTTSPRR